MKTVAVRMGVQDPRLQEYIQRYPFLTGPNEDTNLRAFGELRKGIRTTTSQGEFAIETYPHADLGLSKEQNDIACGILKSVGLDEAAVQEAEHDFAWRSKLIPENCTSVLCLGSGSGEELAFLRARAPHARIVVMDYVKKVWPGLLEALQAEFIQCDLVAELQTQPNQYDAVFSNHTLEHQFDPDKVLRLIHQRLVTGGVLVSGMPMDAAQSIPLWSLVEERCSAPSKLHLIDMGLLDPGHPWKTNAADLHNTLQMSGYSKIRLLQRSDVPYRTPKTQASANSNFYKPVLQFLHVGALDAVRLGIRAMFKTTVPLVVRRTLVALERRVPFGANRLKNRYAPDIVFSATKVV